ncbi:serine hydrolase [Leptobacterium flavescens]|uniref:Serine hydrolase n=1 Tax=Leptobacterium flavescens TaxID=472055 RepID=A0A6P0UTB4_9FLAO|nr:serine hydrolase [Leptobacterium flavescens]NER15079.1 serine hydrolase [Leptobacterium flavescens]
MILTSVSPKKASFFSFFFLAAISVFPQTNNTGFYDNLLEEYSIPGMSIAVIKDGKVDLSHHGVTSNDTKTPVKLNTVFGAASLSKPAFAYAVMKLVEQGKIDLDKPLYGYLKNKDLEDDERHKQITARMILSHSGGLPNWRRGKLKLMHDPGTKFQYSGEGYVYLARVIEHILQKPVNEFMKDLVFKPLGMDHSGFTWEDRFKTNFASPHDYTGSSKPNWRPEKPVVASSLQTTATDYAKLMMAILQRKGLKRSTYRQMEKPQIEISNSLSWGLGWGIQKSPRRKYLWQWGDNGTFKAFAMIYPDKNEGMVFFVNSYKGLRILPKLVDYLFKDTIPEFDMLKNSMRTRADEKLMLSILKNGYEEGAKAFFFPNSTQINTSLINEGQLSFVAMQLKWRKKFAEEKSLLKAIALAYPKSFRAQKSYAAHCIRHGYKEEGIEYYKKALTIDPENKDILNTIHLLTSDKLTGNVTFVFSDYLWASSVSVIGSFNNWSSSSTPLLKKNGVWTTTIQLEPGNYSYQFMVDGYPLLDPKNQVVINKDGQIGSLLKVE